jgi:AraC-like DNA-binding protein
MTVRASSDDRARQSRGRHKTGLAEAVSASYPTDMPPAAPALRWPLLGFVLAHVRARGGDVEALRRRFRLAEGSDVAVLSVARFRELIAAAAVAANDPFLGVHLAASLPRGPLGLLEFASTSAPTLGEGLRRIGRYTALVNEAVEITLGEACGEARLELRIAGEPECLGRHTNEFFVAFVLIQARRATGDVCVPARVWFAHPCPDDVAELLDCLGTTRVEFGCEQNGIALPRALLDLPLATSDPPLLHWLDDQAEAALHERPSTGDFLGRLRASVRAHLAAGTPTVARTARELGMSPRTLQRRLEEEHTTFLALVEAVRADLALYYLRDGNHRLSEIAELCGYSELSAFLRAFKRWTGRTPTELRMSS